MPAAALALETADPLAPRLPPGQDELPYDDGEPMESPKHRDQMNLLIHTLRRSLMGRMDIFIGGNMALYYSELQARNQDFRAPDFFVVTDVIPDRVRKSWVVWEEDGRAPDVVVELLSASTEREDRGRKMRIYASLRVSEYYLFDPHSGLLEGYRLDQRAYAPIPPLPNGDLECRMLNLHLGRDESTHEGEPGPWLRWKTPEGILLPTGDETASAEQARAEEAQARAEEAQARAEEAQARAEEAQARAERLAERLRALGLDPEG